MIFSDDYEKMWAECSRVSMLLDRLRNETEELLAAIEEDMSPQRQDTESEEEASARSSSARIRLRAAEVSIRATLGRISEWRP